MLGFLQHSFLPFHCVLITKERWKPDAIFSSLILFPPFVFRLYAGHLITCKYLLQKQNTFNSRKEKSVKKDKKKRRRKKEEIKENTSKSDRPNKWKCNCCLFLLMCIYVFRCVHSVESLASSVHSSTLSSSTCRHFCDGGQKHCRQHCALLLLSNMDSRHCTLHFYQQNNKGREIPFSMKTKKPVQLRNWRKKRKEKKVGDGGGMQWIHPWAMGVTKKVNSHHHDPHLTEMHRGTCDCTPTFRTQAYMSFVEHSAQSCLFPDPEDTSNEGNKW